MDIGEVPMKDNLEWKGGVNKTLEFNDKEHERIFVAIKELEGSVANLKRQASSWGALAGVIGAIIAFLGKTLFDHLCGR